MRIHDPVQPNSIPPASPCAPAIKAIGFHDTMLMSRFMTPARWLEREIHCMETELDAAIHRDAPEDRWRRRSSSTRRTAGAIYPSVFVKTAQLSPQALRMSEDLFIDQAVCPGRRQRRPLMSARFPRAYLDLNRQPYELDPALFAERIPDYANSSSLRVVGGLGTIPRLVNENEEIYAAPLPLSVGLARVERLYRPYHDRLGRFRGHPASFGRTFLIDCHSMPSHLGEAPGAPAYDIVLGDRFGGACSRDLVDFAATTFSMMGYRVGLNKPYAGGHITEFYGRPAECIHALQIEINRGLYVCEKTLKSNRLCKTEG